MGRQTEYFVSHADQQHGPFTIDQIVQKVKDGELTVVDYIYDDQKNDWVSLMEHDELKIKLQSAKPSAPPSVHNKEEIETLEEVKHIQSGPSEESHSNDNITSEWYVLKGENKFGPFAYTEVIKMLQQKLVFEFDFAWKPGMENWQRVAEIAAFKYDNVKGLKETLMPEIEEVFFRRRHKRAQFGGTILIHDNNKVWKGMGVEISAGGAGVIMDNSMITANKSF